MKLDKELKEALEGAWRAYFSTAYATASYSAAASSTSYASYASYAYYTANTAYYAVDAVCYASNNKEREEQINLILEYL